MACGTLQLSTRLLCSGHCSHTAVHSRHTRVAASAPRPWLLLAPGQSQCLGWLSCNSTRTHLRNPVGHAMAMAHFRCGLLYMAANTSTSTLSSAVVQPSPQSSVHRQIDNVPRATTARPYSAVTAASTRRRNSSTRSRPPSSQELARSMTSLDPESTSSDTDAYEESSTGEESFLGMPRHYDESVIKEEWAATEEEQQFWVAKADKLRRSTAMRAVQQLDPKWRYGVSYERLGGPIKSGLSSDDEESNLQLSEALGNAPSGSLWFRRAKTKDPLAVVLVKVGAFYECVGYDAAMLMEYGGYKPMGGSKYDIPRAGCPDYKIHELLQQLVEEAGLSVAVWEEEPDTKEHGSVRKEQRPRRFAQLVTPESPSYLYGLSSSSQDRHAEAPNIKGITLTSSGCSVFVLNRFSDVVAVYNSISMDSLWSLLLSDGSTAPLVYMHWPLELPRPTAGPTSSQLEQDYLKLKKHLQALCRQLEEGDARVTSYYSVDPLLGFKEGVRAALKWPPDKEIHDLPAWDAHAHWPALRPAYHSTLTQLGLVNNSNMPSLADYLLPRSSGKLPRCVIRSLLINPPPHDVAQATRRLMRRLKELVTMTPLLFDASGSVTPQKVALILGAGEGNEKIFENLLGALCPVIEALTSPALSPLADDVWPLLCHTMSCQPQYMTRERVLQAAQQAAAAIEQVVPVAEIYNSDNSNYNSSSSSATSSTDEDPAPSKLRRKPPISAADSIAGVRRAGASFKVFMEPHKQRVRSEVVEQEDLQVDLACFEVLTVLDGLVHTLIQQAQQAGLDLTAKDLPHVFVDETNLSAWIKVPCTKLRQHMKGREFKVLVCQDIDLDASERVYADLPDPQQLRHPYDRNGLTLKARDVFSCNVLDQVLKKYRDAIAVANAAATNALQHLSQQLVPIKLELSAAVQMGILLQTLYDHSTAAHEAGWSIPAVGIEEQLQAGVSFTDNSHQHGELRLMGLQPYWMSRPDMQEAVCNDTPVRNDVELEGFMLLTGPNMAGKSTVLRSTAAAALCGSVGLAIPAAAGSLLPQLDAIMLRTFTGDAPSDQLSAFGVEMNQMACVLTDARPGSLVLIDELGKGTEVGSGTALASAMLKELVEMGARGIFATHLHGLLDLTAGTPRLTSYSMQVAHHITAAGRKRLAPTWHLVPGHSTQSLALEVARDIGLPEEVIELAKKEYEKVKRLGGYNALIRIAAEEPVIGMEDEAADAAAAVESDRARLVVMRDSADDDTTSSSSSSSSSTRARGSNSSILSSISRAKSRQRSVNGVSSMDVQSQHQQHQERVGHVVAILSKLAAKVHPKGLLHPPEKPTLATAAAAADKGSAASDAASMPSSASAKPSVVHHLYRQGGVGPSGTRRMAGNQPPIAHLITPVLYVAYFEKTGRWHAGQSTDLAERWKSHTYRLGKQRVDMWYVVLTTTDGSVRSQLEGQLHMALDGAGVPLDSKHDAHRARRK